MELELTIRGDFNAILEAVKKLAPKEKVITPAPKKVKPAKSIKQIPPVKTKRKAYIKPDRNCLTCGNPTHGKHGWVANYCSRKCFDASRQGSLPAPREFSIPEEQDMGLVSDRDEKARKTLDKIKHTDPTPQKRPDFQRNMID